MTISAFCRCGKIVFGSEAMAGESAHCSLCGSEITFPSASPLTGNGLGAHPAGAVAAPSRRRIRDYLYWTLLLALLPLIPGLMRDNDPRILERLRETVRAHPEIKPRVEAIMADREATLDELLRILPGKRLDADALLARNSREHWLYATMAAICFPILVRFLFAQERTRIWQLVFIALFTSTVGIAFLFVLEGMVESAFRRALDPERNLFVNFFGYACRVGLCEELCKALPLLWYVRRRERPTWQGACLWGMASGVGFGVAEGIAYSTQLYNGIMGPEPYVSRFISCVTLHAVWSASVGLTLYHCRGMVRHAVGDVLYEGVFQWSELVWPLLRILGVAMILHGAYDAFLTKDMIAPALLVALISFAWLGWQIETCREVDDLRAAYKARPKVAQPAHLVKTSTSI
jgi:RsiW-degrading membrane proteinase PrsW (M82 family)